MGASYVDAVPDANCFETGSAVEFGLLREEGLLMCPSYQPGDLVVREELLLEGVFRVRLRLPPARPFKGRRHVGPPTKRGIVGGQTSGLMNRRVAG